VGVSEIRTSQRFQYSGAKGIELQVDLQARRDLRETFRKARLVRNAYTVRIQHEMADWPVSRQFENLKDLRVLRRLTPRNLDDGRLAFVGNCSIQHALDLLQTAVCLSLRPTACVTGRAAQVTVVGDFKQQRATVLLVVRTDSTVVGATVPHRCVGRYHLLRRLDECFPRELVIANIICHQHSLSTVRWTAFQHPHTTVLEHNFRVNALQAGTAN
jgi:hypothetical protein